MDTSCINLIGICKTQHDKKILRNLNLKIAKGEIYGLVGEVKSGKSLSVDIINGLQSSDKGAITRDGKLVTIDTVQTAQAWGISTVFQKGNLLDAFTIKQNLLISPRLKTLYKKAPERYLAFHQLCEELEFTPDLKTYVYQLTEEEKVLVSIARALLSRPALLIIDEACNQAGSNALEQIFKILTRLTMGGSSVLFVSRNLEQIREVCTRCGVLHKGEITHEFDPHRESDYQIERWMSGEEVLIMPSPPAPSNSAPTIFAVQNLSVLNPYDGTQLKNLNLALSKGGIVGVFSPEPRERAFLLSVLSGESIYASIGRIILGGTSLTDMPINQRHAQGLIYLPLENVKNTLLPYSSLVDNFLLAQRKISPWSSLASAPALTEMLLSKENIPALAEEDTVEQISNGLLKRFLLARSKIIAALEKTPVRVLLVASPGNGTDLITRGDIYHSIVAWSKQGVAVLLVSDDLDEILLFSQSIAILHQGQLSPTIPTDVLARSKLEAFRNAPFSRKQSNA